MNITIERIKFILAVVLYGTIGLFLRFVYLPSEAVALYRGVIGAIFILMYRVCRKEHPDLTAVRKNLGWFLVSDIGLGFNWIFLFAAYTSTSVAVASLCNYMAPIFVIILTPIVLREKLDKRKIPCIAAALIGIVLVSGIISGNVGSPTGILFGLAAACCFTSIIFCNRKLRDISTLDRAMVQLAVAVITILPYVLIRNGGRIPLPDPRSGWIILMLGVVQTGIAYCLYFSGMASLPVQSIAILGYLEPIVSVLCSVLFLHEPLGWIGWIGAAMVLISAIISEIIPAREKFTV